MPPPDLSEISDELLQLLPEQVAREHDVLPFAREQGVLLVAYAYRRLPHEARLRKRLREWLTGPFELVAIRRDDLEKALDDHYRDGAIVGCEYRASGDFSRYWSRCARRWRSLVPTEHPDVRYCTECGEAIWY